jgi:hypothetical protein
MTEATKNPYTPIELWEDTIVSVKEGDETKKVDAKHYRIMYVVGESEDKTYVDSGKDAVEAMSSKTMHLAPSIHRIAGEPFHYDRAVVESVTGDGTLKESTKKLIRQPACEEHKTVEVIFESPGVECCAMTKEQADSQRVPLQYVSGYLLGRKDGLLKVALSKTVTDSGYEYYDHIHVIPESAVKQWGCLE